MQAFEVTGTIDSTGRVTLDQPLEISRPGRIRLIVLLEESNENPANSQLTHSDTTPPSSQQAVSQFSFDPDAQPVWELVAEISAQVPDEEWAKLPTDLAKNFDKYQRQRSNE